MDPFVDSLEQESSALLVPAISRNYSIKEKASELCSVENAWMHV